MLLDKVLYEMDEEAEEELYADLIKAQKYVERLGYKERGGRYERGSR